MPMAHSRAPELHSSLVWLNSERQSLRATQGMVRLIVFWNAASVHCCTLADVVSRMQARHPRGLAVFAIHVPKFDAEQDAAVVLRASERLGFVCPVANDRAWVAWRHFEMSAWPSIVLVDAEGEVRHVFVGDHPGMRLENALMALLSESAVLEKAQPLIHTGPASSEFSVSPCGLAVSDAYLYVADTRHHRILECTHKGRVCRQFGTGQGDFVDGAADAAGFRFPRGLHLGRDGLFVADSGNHAVRRIDLLTGEVETLLGNGLPGVPVAGSPAHSTHVSLNQPWGLAGDADHLFISVAGCNQVWDYNLKKAALSCLAGNGELRLLDGQRQAASLAHPAGMALVQRTLYVADSASSAIRAIKTASGVVTTLVGQGVYEFGNSDGLLQEARLQYPLAVAWDPDAPALWVADAYNARLRRLRLGGGELIGHALPLPLKLPSALATGAGSLWIADCDAHAIFRLEHSSGRMTSLMLEQ